MSHTKQHTAEKYLTRPQFAKHRNVSLRLVDYWTASGAIPVLRFGRKCLRIPVQAADAELDRRFLVKGGAK